VAKDKFDDLPNSVIRANLQHLLNTARDSKRQIPETCYLFVRSEDMRCIAAADSRLSSLELENLEYKEEVHGLKARNRALQDDIKKMERGQR